MIKTDGETIWIENEVGVGFVNQLETPGTPNQPDIPKTGDNSNLLMWLILVGMSASTLTILWITTLCRKRESENK